MMNRCSECGEPLEEPYVTCGKSKCYHAYEAKKRKALLEAKNGLSLVSIGKDNTVEAAVEQLIRWQRKHRIPDGQIEELLRWFAKPPIGTHLVNQFNVTSTRILEEFKSRRDVLDPIAARALQDNPKEPVQ